MNVHNPISFDTASLQVNAYLRRLSDNTNNALRLRIFVLSLERPRKRKEICETLHIGYSVLQPHLSKMVEAGLVELNNNNEVIAKEVAFYALRDFFNSIDLPELPEVNMD